jgi:hypothetical protein
MSSEPGFLYKLVEHTPAGHVENGHSSKAIALYGFMMAGLFAYFLNGTWQIFQQRYKPPTEYSTQIGGFNTLPDIWTCLGMDAEPEFTYGYVQHPNGDGGKTKTKKEFGLFNATAEAYVGTATGMKKSCIKFSFSSVAIQPLPFHLHFTGAWSIDTDGKDVMEQTPQYIKGKKFGSVVMTQRDQIIQTPLTLGIGAHQFQHVFSLQEVNIKDPDYWWKKEGWKTLTEEESIVHHQAIAATMVPNQIMKAGEGGFNASDPKTVNVLSNRTGEEIQECLDPESGSKRQIIWARWHLILALPNVDVEIREYKALMSRFSKNLGVSAGYMSIVSAIFYLVFRRKFPRTDDEKTTVLTLRGHEEKSDAEKQALVEKPAEQEKLITPTARENSDSKPSTSAGG